MLNAKHFICFLILGGGILVFIFLVIWPRQKEFRETDIEINKIKARIEEQKILFPVFNDLRKKEQNLKDMMTSLSFLSEDADNETEPTTADPDKIASAFQEIARNSDFRVETIQPDVKSLADDSGYLIIRMSIRGNFSDLHNFLIRIVKVPYVAHIEQIQIRPDRKTKGKIKEISLKIWIKIQD